MILSAGGLLQAAAYPTFTGTDPSQNGLSFHGHMGALSVRYVRFSARNHPYNNSITVFNSLIMNHSWYNKMYDSQNMSRL